MHAGENCAREHRFIYLFLFIYLFIFIFYFFRYDLTMEKLPVAILVFVIITPTVFGVTVEPFLSLPGNKTVVTFLDLHLSYHDNGTCGDPDWRMWELMYSLEWKALSEENIGIRQCSLQYDDDHNKSVLLLFAMYIFYLSYVLSQRQGKNQGKMHLIIMNKCTFCSASQQNIWPMDNSFKNVIFIQMFMDFTDIKA